LRAITSEPEALPTWRAALAEGRWAVLVLLCLGIWLHAADALVVATTMPAIVAEVGGLAWVGWSLALYEVGSILAGALGGLTAARYGAGPALAVAAGIYALGCLASGLAPDMGWFLAGRSVQGFGGGAMVALCHIAVTRAFAEAFWGRIYGLISAVWGVSALAGPLIGGLFAEAGLWRWAYFVFALQAVLVVLLAPMLLRSGRAAEGRAAPSKAPVPWLALAALVPGILGIAAAGVVERSWLAALLALGGLAFLALFFRLDRRAVASLLPHRSLGAPHVVWGLVLVLAFCTANVSFALYGPLLLERLHGIGPLGAGYLLSLESVAWSVAAVLTARTRPEGEGRLLKLGALGIALSIVLFAIGVPDGPVLLIGAAACVSGGGFGLFWSFLVRRVVAAARPRDRELAAGAVPTLQMLGYALGAAAAGILANVMGFTAEAAEATVVSIARWIFLAFLPLGALGLLAAWRVAR
jgi:MFS family permease